MKRITNIFEKVCNVANIEIADNKARKGKKNKYGIRKHDENRLVENIKLSNLLRNGDYKTSKYTKGKIYEPKERVIYKLPYYPDRITHHAIMNILEPIWTKIFIKNTYSCIKGRGIHKLLNDLKKDLQNNKEETTYCLKLDIKKFYPSINHEILKNIIRRKIKDAKILSVLDEIIDSVDCSEDISGKKSNVPTGVPIGNYLSQYFANLYLAYFDHWVKEELRAKYYYRYADDIVLLSSSKDLLRNYLIAIKFYLKYNLKLALKDNYLIFPIEARGIDYIGYKIRHNYTLLRKSIKNKMMNIVKLYQYKNISEESFTKSIESYFGWTKYCNSKKLLSIILNKTGKHYTGWNGIKTNISSFKNKKIYVFNIVLRNKYFIIQFIYKRKSYEFRSSNGLLFLSLILESLPKLFTLY